MTTLEKKNLIGWVRKNKCARAARILEQFRLALAKQQLAMYITIFNDNLNIQRKSEFPIFHTSLVFAYFANSVEYKQNGVIAK